MNPTFLRIFGLAAMIQPGFLFVPLVAVGLVELAIIDTLETESPVILQLVDLKYSSG